MPRCTVSLEHIAVLHCVCHLNWFFPILESDNASPSYELDSVLLNTFFLSSHIRIILLVSMTLVNSFFWKLFNLFCYTADFNPVPVHPLTVPSLSPWGCPNPTRPRHSLGSPVPWGIGTSSLTEPRPGSPLLYICLGASYQLVFADWLVVQYLKDLSSTG